MSEWSLVGGILGVKKRTPTPQKFFLLSILLKWLPMYVDHFHSQEKSKSFESAVYAVSIFIFFSGWLHISKSSAMLTT